MKDLEMSATDRPLRAGLDKDPHDVAGMFDAVARRYDLTNTLTTAGLDRRWRRLTREGLRLVPGERALDVGAGTGVSTEELARSGAYVVGCDFSIGMLAARGSRAVPLLAGDAIALPFADGVFDAVTITFALRNVGNPERALQEFLRVARPGGRLVVTEFSRPTSAVLRFAYQRVALRMLELVAGGVSSAPPAYGYLAESIKAWPDQPTLARSISAAGWREVRWRNVTGGIVAIHRAVK